jgi:hypothetical protein
MNPPKMYDRFNHCLKKHRVKVSITSVKHHPMFYNVLPTMVSTLEKLKPPMFCQSGRPGA